MVAITIGVTIEPELATAQNFTLQLPPFMPSLLKESFNHPFPSKVPKLAPSIVPSFRQS